LTNAYNELQTSGIPQMSVAADDFSSYAKSYYSKAAADASPTFGAGIQKGFDSAAQSFGSNRPASNIDNTHIGGNGSSLGHDWFWFWK
jgi:hypothetical protein